MSDPERRTSLRRTFHSSGNQFVGAASFSGRGAEAGTTAPPPLSLQLLRSGTRNVADRFEVRRIKKSA